MENSDDVMPHGSKLKMLWDCDTFDYIISNYGKLKLENEGLAFIESVFNEERHTMENYYLKSLLYSYFDRAKSMNYYKMIKKMENPADYNIELLYWCNRKKLKANDIKKYARYITQKYNDDEMSANINIALKYAQNSKFAETKQYLQRVIKDGKNNVLLWLVLLKHEDFSDFRRTNEFTLLIKENAPVMKIIDYGGSKEIDFNLDFLKK
ncbi:MAG: hypothetical protein LBG95_02265 [Treponema sp.]|nr:hypothetical protein [Treponema sp.]